MGNFHFFLLSPVLQMNVTQSDMALPYFLSQPVSHECLSWILIITTVKIHTLLTQTMAARPGDAKLEHQSKAEN